MELMQLRYFILVAEQKKISKAAVLAYTSQSNISKQIQQLESELACKLFERGNTGVELTTAGSYLYKELKPVLAQMDHIFEGLHQDEHRTLYLSILSSLDTEWSCPSLIRKLRQRCNAPVHIESDSFQNLINKILLAQVDVGLVFSNFDTKSPLISRKALCRNTPLLYYSVNHPLADRPALSINDFKMERFSIVSGGYVSRNLIDSLPFSPREVLQTNSIDAITAYLLAGETVAVLGQNQVVRNNARIRTLEIPTGKTEGIDIIWNKNNSRPDLQDFIECISSIFAEYSAAMQSSDFDTV